MTQTQNTEISLCSSRWIVAVNTASRKVTVHPPGLTMRPAWSEVSKSSPVTRTDYPASYFEPGVVFVEEFETEQEAQDFAAAFKLDRIVIEIDTRDGSFTGDMYFRQTARILRELAAKFEANHFPSEGAYNRSKQLCCTVKRG